MYEEKYQEAIDKLKEVYPQFKDVKFDISNGELGYISGAWSLVEQININELQQFVNSFLGQKVYRAEYIGYIDVYARSGTVVTNLTSPADGRLAYSTPGVNGIININLDTYDN